MTPEEVHETENVLQRLTQVTKDIHAAHKAIAYVHGGGKPVGDSYDMKFQVEHERPTLHDVPSDPNSIVAESDVTFHDYSVQNAQRKILMMGLALQEAIEEREDLLKELQSRGVEIHDYDLDDLPDVPEAFEQSAKLLFANANTKDESK